MAILFLWLTRVQFILHSCDLFSADSGPKPTVSWQSWTGERLRPYGRDPPRSLDRHPAQPLWEPEPAALFPLPSLAVTVGPWRGGLEQTAMTDSHQLSARGALSTEWSAVFDHSVLSLRVSRGHMQHLISAASTWVSMIPKKKLKNPNFTLSFVAHWGFYFRGCCVVVEVHSRVIFFFLGHKDHPLSSKKKKCLLRVFKDFIYWSWDRINHSFMYLFLPLDNWNVQCFLLTYFVFSENCLAL